MSCVVAVFMRAGVLALHEGGRGSGTCCRPHARRTGTLQLELQHRPCRCLDQHILLREESALGQLSAAGQLLAANASLPTAAAGETIHTGLHV